MNTNINHEERESLLDYLAERTIPQGANGCHEYAGKLNSHGYPSGGKTIRGKVYRTHRVAAIISTGRLPNECEQASHLCHNKSCIAPSHLLFETQSENMKRSSEVISKSARKSQARPEVRAKKSEAMRKMYEDPVNRAKNSEAQRKRYENPVERAKTSEAIRNSSHKEATRNRRSNKLTMGDAREIRRLYATGNYTQRKLAKMYGCSQTQIYNILNNIKWIE